MLHDIRYACRNLRHAPGLAGVIVLTLALGIGANTAIFSVVKTLVFDPLPYPESDRLVAVTFDNESPLGFQNWVFPKYQAFASTATQFEATAAYGRAPVTVQVGDVPQRLEAEFVTASYFPILRLAAARGRVFQPHEDRVPGERPVVVLSDTLWRRAFGGDPAAVGGSLMIQNRTYEILGVMPAGFGGQTGQAELWIPAMMAEQVYFKGAVTGMFAPWVRVMARLRPGVGLAQANAAMPGITARVLELADQWARDARRKDGTELIRALPLKAVKVDPAVSRAFLLLLGAVGFVLLIACANTANLLLGRAVARHRDFAVRRAIGASGMRLARQVVVESLVFSALASMVGLLAAIWMLDWITAATPWNATGLFAEYSRTFEYFRISLDWQALLFNFLLAAVVGLVFGTAPAWHAAGTDVSATLKDGGGLSSTGARLHGVTARTALVFTEVVFSLVLLVAAGLMVRSFANVVSVDLGFDPDRLVAMRYTPTGRKPLAFYEELLERVEAVPGVERASLSVASPFGPDGRTGRFDVEGRPREAGRLEGMLDVASPELFATYGIRVAEGRRFTAADRTPAPRVAIVSRTLAERAWPGESALGKKVRHDLVSRDYMEVVGVVEPVVYTSIEEGPTAMIYVPHLQPAGKPEAVTIPATTITVRTTLQAATVAAGVRDVLRSLDAAAPVYGVTTLNEAAARVTSRYRYTTLMMSGMALLALALAAIGTYGVIAYGVSARTREIGIRIALGAQPGDVFRLVVGGGLKLALLAIVVGLAGAFAASRLLSALLFGITPADPLTFAVTGALMAVVAALASYIPARRALAVDPVVALRRE